MSFPASGRDLRREDDGAGTQPAPVRRTAYCLLAVRRNPDLDLLRLRFLTLRQVYGQKAVVVVGLDGLGVHRIRQRETARERAVGAFHSKVVVLVDLLLELALAGNRQSVVLDANVDVLLVDVREDRP